MSRDGRPRGNVERAVIAASGGVALLELPAGTRPRPRSPGTVLPPPEIIPEQEWRRRERANVLAALQHANGRVSGPGGAAALLGVNPRTLASRIKALGLHRRQRHVDQHSSPDE